MKHSLKVVNSDLNFNVSGPNENERQLLTAIMNELTNLGKPVTNKTIVANIIYKLELEADEILLQQYRNILNKIMEKRSNLL
ncbi:MAG: biofilm development regulator YmgB/AriR family protein [Candidatus Dasytiphilus stammeri]